MDLNQLLSFEAVAKTLSFTGAARRLGLPQSTVSRHIGDLEQQLQAKLFFRTKRDVQLTEEGRAFLPYAGEILQAARRGADAVQQLRTGATGRLSLAVSAAPAGLLERSLSAFHRAHPAVAVALTTTSCGRCLMDEEGVPYDLQFLPRELFVESEQLQALPLGEEGLSLLAPPGCSLAPGPVELGAVQAEPFILLAEAEHPILYMQALALCRARRFTPHIVSRPQDVDALRRSVAAGLGVSILPTSLAGPQGRPIRDTEGGMAYAAVWRTSLLNPALRLYLPFLRAAAHAGDAASSCTNSPDGFAPPPENLGS